jgi:hypothetical protein
LQRSKRHVAVNAGADVRTTYCVDAAATFRFVPVRCALPFTDDHEFDIGKLAQLRSSAMVVRIDRQTLIFNSGMLIDMASTRARRS